MSKSNAALYGLLTVLNAGLAQFALELGAGNVPVPPEWRWVVPIAVAALTSATALLPRMGKSDGA